MKKTIISEQYRIKFPSRFLRGVALIAMCGATLLSGCSGAAEVTLDGSTAAIPAAGIAMEFPDNYTVITGDEIYRTLGGALSYSASAEEIKAEYDENGISYLVHATDGSDIIVISAQDMTPDEDTERTTLEDYARQVHDTTIFEYYASGYRTTENTSLSEASYGGKDGWVSFFEVTTAPTDGGEPQFVIGYIEFMFESGNNIYCIQVGLSQQTNRETAVQIFGLIEAYP